MVLLIFISFAALYLQTKAVFHSEIDHPIRADASLYYAYAYNLDRYNIYSSEKNTNWNEGSSPPKPDAIVTPGYPLLLSFFIDNPNINQFLLNISMIQIVFSLICLPLLFFVLKNFLAPGAALLAVALTAISPHLVNMNIYLLTESFFTFLLVLSLFFISKAADNKKWTFSFLAGLTIGYASLTRPALQYFIVILVPFIWFSFGRRYAGRIIVFMLLGFVLVYGSWMTRNYISLGQTSDSLLVKSTLYHGMYPDLMYQNKLESRGIPYRYDPNVNEISKDRDSVLHEIQRRFSEEPLRHIQWYLVGKPLTLWSWSILAGMGDVFIYPVTKSPYFDNIFSIITHRVMYYLHWPLLVLAFIGCFIAWMKPDRLFLSASSIFFVRLLSLVLIYFTALHIVAAPYPRYSIPLRPVMYGMSVFSGMVLFGHLKNYYIKIFQARSSAT